MSDDPEVIGDWVRERVLGCGGFGVVTLWKNIRNSERVAIKKYRGDSNSLQQKQRDRWTQEVEMMQRINCENIVSFQRLPSIFQAELNKYNPTKLLMLSMEYCTQGDLRAVLSRSENCCGLPESDVRYILKDLMNAVSYLHSLKITHRDLKPENIVLQLHDRPNGIIYKLIDLGYAKEIDAKSICASFVGTLQYLAPELMYSKTYSCSVDYWSMGLVAFEIICGTRPFLPNMSPAQWMYHVNKKPSETICIYQQNESNDSIKYSKEIFSECHVSTCFKREIEQWLQLALEYAPRKRGYVNYDPEKSDNELAIFTNLKALLEKKILTVFLVYTSEFCSYEIDDYTLVDTLQGWIERDSKIVKDEQIFIAPKCDNIDLTGLATQFFDETYVEPMLYVFKKNEILDSDIKPKFIPDLVKVMLNDATKELQYYFQKRSYAHGLYFIFLENKLYNTILDACALNLKNTLKICDQISHTCRNMNTNIEKLNAQKNFVKELLDFDYEQYLKNFSQNADHWTQSFNVIVEKIDKIHGVCNSISIRHESAYRRATQLSVTFNKDYSKHNSHDLNELLDEAVDYYRTVRTRSKEKRTKPESCKLMMKYVYLLLKSRDKLLRNEVFRNYLQMIVNINHELDKMATPLNSTMEHIEKFRKDLVADSLARQTKIWEFTIKQKSKKTTETDIAQFQTNFILGNPSVVKEDYGSPISLIKPLHFILGDQQKIQTSLESNSSYHSAAESQAPQKTISKSLEPEKRQLPITRNINNSLEINSNGISKNNSSNRKLKNSVPYSTPIKKPNKQNNSQLNNNQVPKTDLDNNNETNLQDHNSAVEDNENKNDSDITPTPSLIQPNFLIGQPASDLINYNLSLRHELQEKTNESFVKYKSIINETLDFSFLNE